MKRDKIIKIEQKRQNETQRMEKYLHDVHKKNLMHIWIKICNLEFDFICELI